MTTPKFCVGWFSKLLTIGYPVHTLARKGLRYFIVVWSSTTHSRSQWPRGLLPLACWDCGFESQRGHGCLSFVSVVCCQLEVSVSARSLAQRSPTEWVCVSLSVIAKPRYWGCLGPLATVVPWKKVLYTNPFDLFCHELSVSEWKAKVSGRYFLKLVNHSSI
jgi:hypothetical protein